MGNETLRILNRRLSITEEEFSLVRCTRRATVMENLCSYIQQLGSGSGICTCGTGG